MKSKEFSDKSIQPPSTFDNSLNAGTNYYHNSKIRIKFDGSCLKQDKEVTFTHKQVVKTYIVFEINLWNYAHSDDPTLGTYFLCATKLVKNADTDKYQ